jgi:iron complex outermembrane recepter protein
VPAGPTTVRVFFTGLDEKEIPLTITAGQTAQLDVKLTSQSRYGSSAETVMLDAFTVQSTRETNASTIAVNEQRVANNIKSVVATEEFGTIPDSSPGELLKWLPGVGVEYFANNVTGVNVRGLGSVNTELIFDGMPVATANADGTNRTFEIKGASASDIARVEIRKLPLPEDSANAIGGTINMIRRSAFEYSKRRIEYSALFTSDGEKITLAERDGPKDRKQQYWQPNWQVKWTEPVNKNFGLAFTAGQTNTIVRVHWNNPTWNYGTAAQKTQAEADIAAGRPLTTVNLYNPAMTQMLLHDAPTKDSRDYASVRADWRPVPGLTLGYSFSYTKFYSQQADDIRYTWNAAATGSGDPQFVDRRTMVGRVGGGSIQYNTPLWRDINQPTLAHNIESTWKRNGWTASLRGAFSQSKYYINSADHGFFNSTSGGGVPATGVGSGTANPIPITVTFRDVDYRGPREIEARDAAGNLVDWSSTAVARIGGAVDRPGRAKDDVTAMKAYLRKDFSFENPLSIQAGFDFSEQYRNRRYSMNVWRFVGADHIAATADDSAAAITAVDLKRSGDTWAHTPPIDHISLTKLYKLYQDHPDYFVYDDNQSYRNSVTNPYTLTEKNSAPYLEFFQKLFRNRLELAGGVRYERAEADALGYFLDQSAAYQKYSDGSVRHANDVIGANGLPTTRAGAPVFLPGVTAGSYQEALLTMKSKGARGHGIISNSFPSLHAAYNLTENLKLQVGWAKTQARNRFDRTVVPNTTVNDTPQALNGAIGVVNVRNPELQPWIGYNYEARLSYYSKLGGNIGVAVFRKSIHNWQASFVDYLATAEDAAAYGLNPQYVGYNASTMYNNGNARIDGAEFELRQPLDRIMPNGVKGLSASATYSYTNLVGQAPNTDLGSVFDYRGTFFLRWVRPKVSGSIGYIRNGPNANGVPTGAGVTGIQVQVPQDMFDFSFEYRFTRSLQFFMSGRNIFKEWRLREARIPGAPNYAVLNSSTNLGVTFTVGIKGELDELFERFRRRK